jgi:hypothetical protein
MQLKLSVVLLKGQNINAESDINKMAVHLEQMLTEKDGVDLKVRQSLTEPTIRKTDFIVFCGYDTALLSELFKAMSVVETCEPNEGPTLFLYDEPGQSIQSHIDYIIRAGVDIRRIDPKLFDKVIDTWSHNDIIGYINVALRRLGTSSDTGNNLNSPAKRAGTAVPGDDPSA